MKMYEKRVGLEKWTLLSKLFSSMASENETMLNLAKFTDGDVYMTIYGCNKTKDELEDMFGFPLKSEYIGNGMIRFIHEGDGFRVIFEGSGRCKKIGTKKKKIQKTVEVTPAVTKVVDEVVEVGVYECSKGEKFDG